VRDCYNQGLRRDPKLAGTVLLRFVIGESGAVTSLDSSASTFPDPVVVSCVANQIRGLVFPKPEGGPVTVNYPFAFREQ
jgi:Ca-activated chloride channel family protein